MEIATTSGTTRPANGAVDPLGSGRLVGLNGPVSFTDNYTCHRCGKETNRDTNPRQNHTATLSRDPTPPTPGTAGGEVTEDIAILNPANNNRPPTVRHPRSNLQCSGVGLVNLILRLVYSCLVDSFLYFIYSKLSLGTYVIINLLVPPPSPPLGWDGNLRTPDPCEGRAALDSYVYHSLSGAIRSVLERS